jgi:two-component system chemotaxis response regulator CheB
MRALDVGALAAVRKPPSPSSSLFDRAVRELLFTLRALAKVRVITHRSRLARPVGPMAALAESMRSAAAPGISAAQEHCLPVVGMAASTGGPTALQHILSRLPGDLPAALLMVQHTAVGFTEGLAEWLGRRSKMPVKLAEQGERLRPATVYLAPDEHHLTVNAARRAFLTRTPPVSGFRPSATELFTSLASGVGAGALGIILTGMGNDGVDGLRALRAAGGRVLAQDRDTSLVFGMPQAAIAANVVDAVLPLQHMAGAIIGWLEPPPHPG